MKNIPKGHIRYKGKTYLRPAYAAKLMGVHSGTIAHWYREGKIPGVELPSQFGTRKVVYVLKSRLNSKLHDFRCAVCKKRFVSKVVRKPDVRTFCSEKCANSWWNYYAPVRAGVRGKRRD